MLTYVTITSTNSIFTTEVDAVVVPVNCVGVLGKGVALQAKIHLYGTDYAASYIDKCDRHLYKPGLIGTWKAPDSTQLIINAATKDHWRNDSQIEWIIAILKELRERLLKSTCLVKSIAITQIGCGLGNLSWEDVGPLFAQYLGNLPEEIAILVFINQGDEQYQLPQPEPTPTTTICSGCPDGWCVGCAPIDEAEPLSDDQIKKIDEWEQELKAGFVADNNGLLSPISLNY